MCGSGANKDRINGWILLISFITIYIYVTLWLVVTASAPPQTLVRLIQSILICGLVSVHSLLWTRIISCKTISHQENMPSGISPQLEEFFFVPELISLMMMMLITD